MKTISIRLDDSIYTDLSEMLDLMGQTKQTFYESFTREALRQRSIPFIIKAPLEHNHASDNKLIAFERLEKTRMSATDNIDYSEQRALALDEKYGFVD